MTKHEFGVHLITIQNAFTSFDGEKPSDIEDLAGLIKDNILPILAFLGDKTFGGDDFEKAKFG